MVITFTALVTQFPDFLPYELFLHDCKFIRNVNISRKGKVDLHLFCIIRSSQPSSQFVLLQAETLKISSTAHQVKHVLRLFRHKSEILRLIHAISLYGKLA